MNTYTKQKHEYTKQKDGEDIEKECWKPEENRPETRSRFEGGGTGGQQKGNKTGKKRRDANAKNRNLHRIAHAEITIHRREEKMGGQK